MNDRESEEDFDYMLDEIYPLVKVGPAWFNPSKVLKLCDEVTYNSWYWEWINNTEE